jgi:hypothetical protein
LVVCNSGLADILSQQSKILLCGSCHPLLLITLLLATILV